MRISLSLFTLVVAVWMPFACHRADPRAGTIPQERVPHANDRAEAQKALGTWDAHLSKAKELATRADYRGAMAEIEHAMRLVKRFGIRDEGVTFNDLAQVFERCHPREREWARRGKRARYKFRR